MLGMKKRGFGAGKFNGYGGKPLNAEQIEKTAIRELYEEVGVIVVEEELRKAAELTFIFPSKKEWDQKVHVFLASNWSGQPVETEEMCPQWFSFDALPFEKMWPDDPDWLPLVLQGQKVSADFHFAADSDGLNSFLFKDVRVVDSLI